MEDPLMKGQHPTELSIMSDGAVAAYGLIIYFCDGQP